MIPALFLAVPLAALFSPGQTVSPPPPTDPQQRAAEELEFGTSENRMTVPVTIGAAGPFRFIVDTGSERTVVSRELGATLRLAPGRSVKVTAMAGPMWTATVLMPQIVVGLPRAGAVLVANRIEAPALQRRNLGADGLVGIDTLQGKAVTIDFARQAMTVSPASRRTRAERFGPNDIVIRARSLFGQLVVTDATYEGRRIRVVIDTGSVVSMGNVALQRLVARTSSQMTGVRLLSVTGAILNAQYGVVTGVRIGEIGLANLPIAFSDAAPFERFGLGKRPALLLGMDALRLFGQVRIDFANRELHLARPKPGPAPL
ncbi:aspartyl protease family protein [Sphingomonas sp. TREG-RG-20F-R18-01]|uniref:aspartyl protease family protein n=1 Tax=Sphingomonas sp. TREG-RG-20F-R18-01 TaxID=2914982 RepID=UPI001F5686E2|nr:aspartyl protease family protein [Sphingomonas sp. TREG-RG-20F-R18-01]